jgi:hypothetical protein
MIHIVHESGEFAQLPLEECCFCKRPTPYWATIRNVCVCPTCACSRSDREIPTKQEWMNSAQEPS